jgi:hypothetical protein
MGKDLRTVATHWKLHRVPRIDGAAWNMRDVQGFFPPLEKLFKTEALSNLKDYGVKLLDEIGSVVDAEHIKTSKGTTVEVHRKTTMILSPFKWMRGDYGVFGLPKPAEVAAEMEEKLQSPHTAAYVGALTSIALSESGCPNFPKVYGVYAGLATQHTVDISDDYEELSERHWFANNLGKTFELKMRTPETPKQLVVGEEDATLDVEDINADHVDGPAPSDAHSASYVSGSVGDDDSDDDSDVFEIMSCDCSEDSADSEADSDEEEEPFAWAIFKDVPVMTTVMEKCEGTFYELVKAHPEPEKHVAWVAQITLALAFAQRNFGFTHNDLHGNNVMYVPTTQEFLYYKHNGTCYRIPTYGYLIKIIDFDRAIISVRLVGMKDPRQFVSSQFHPDDEAGGQYNMEPYFVQEHPHIAPNPSFDLCRFATSMFWDMFPEGPDFPCTHPLFDLFKQWMTQSDGTSVFFRKQKDDHDRYHGFDLYKAIARYCKDSATPRRELAKLAPYGVPSPPLGAPCLFIES